MLKLKTPKVISEGIKIYVFMTLFQVIVVRDIWSTQPHFETINNHKVLMVNDKPFLLLGVEGRADIPDNLLWAVNNYCNVYKAAISWRRMEPTKDAYDWTILDSLVSRARTNNIKLHLIYLGFNRGGEAERYVPDYIKNDRATYQCVTDANGQCVGWHWGGNLQLCANDPETMEREIKMFEAMMTHIKEIDAQDQTVITIQILNEVGNHEIDRCHDPVCDTLYAQGGWTDGVEFYAWSIANHIEELARAGRAIYDIPCNINTYWAGSNSWYNSEPHRHRQLYLDTAPHIDYIGLDYYPHSINDMRSHLSKYAFGRNIICLTETTTDQPKSAEFFIYQVLGEFGSIGQSTWSVGTCFPNANTATPYNQGSQAGIELSRAYKAINDAMAPIAIYQTTPKLAWFVPTKATNLLARSLVWFVPARATKLTRTVNDITLKISLVNDQGKGIIVQPVQGKMDFTLVGNDYTVELPDLVPGEPIWVEKGRWDGYVWVPTNNVTFDRSGGKVTVTMPEPCTIRVHDQDAPLHLLN